MSGALEASGGFEVPTPILNAPLPDYVIRLNDAADHFLMAEMKGRTGAGFRR
jgi:hypothetical protein